MTKLPTSSTEARYAFGYSLLGPAVAEYLMKLHAHAQFFKEVRDAKILFLSRAGIRIRRALDVFCKRAELPLVDDADYFWISRLMAVKGTWKRNAASAIEVLKNEFHHQPVGELVQAMFRHDGMPEGFPLDHPSLKRKGSDLEAFFKEKGPAAKALISYFQEQSALFEDYVGQLLGGKTTALLIDTGWAGTTQRLLADAFPEIEWWGAYFGRYGFAHTNRKYWRNMLGLVFEQDAFDYEKPETCVIHHRHMIEDIFEPQGSSIERLVRADDGKIIAPEAQTILNDAPTRESDPIYSGVLAYLEELPQGSTPASLHKAARKAWRELARIVCLPTREEAGLFADVKRSADFGKSLHVPLLLPPEDRHEGDSPQQRIRDALWQAGQIAVEYPRELADQMQRKLAGLDLFAFREDKRNPSHRKKPGLAAKIRQDKPAVAIITRTLDRPMFLRRALESVARQTFTDYVHVIVNDGGDAELARKTIEEADCRHHQVILVDNVVNRGMEAASNIGIRAVDSDYIVIHDDDDTWEPEFLEKTVAFLDGPKGRVYGGVITRSTYISEEVTPHGIVFHGKAPYQGWVENIHIMEMAVQNFFPPIAFLYKREIYEKIGGYNEDYPVLGDWDFNLRFLKEADIGVIPEPLANYHHRDKGDTTLFGNSVIAGRDKHLEYAAIVRNGLVRSLMKEGQAAMAVLAGFGLHYDALRQRTQQIHGLATSQRTVIDSLAQQTQALARRTQEAVQEAYSAEQTGLDSDDYWVAMNRLEKAVIRQDFVVLGRIGMKSGNPVRRFFQRFVGGRNKSANMEGRLSLDAIRYLTTLNKKGYELEPPPDFDDEAYLMHNPDVAAAVDRGDFSCGFDHYYRYGRKEGRPRATRKV